MKMACQAMYRWNLIDLVGAFVELVIAYCLLCASAIAYMASKFLGFFGLRLPCPSCGLYGADPNRILCLQKLLIDYPTEKVSNVQLSVMSKFPFNDSVWRTDRNYDMNLRLIGDKGGDLIEMEGEASSSSLLSDSGKPNSIVRIKGDLNAAKEMRAAYVFGEREGRFDLKGKGSMHQRLRSGIRRRKKGSFDFGKHSSVSSYDRSIGEVKDGDSCSPPSINKGGNDLVEDDTVHQHYERDKHPFNLSPDTEETPPILKWGKRSSNRFELREAADCHDVQDKEFKDNGHLGLDLSGEDKSTIRLLEQAFEEEQAARAALYLELEKERSAAASAADEAMAMIQRLQEEKASVEMEARQYQRMIEEKSAYDAEEMNILKEIIVRRERENHFLEKEIEQYRQLSNVGNERSSTDEADMLGDQQTRFDYLFDTNDDPMLMLHHLSSTIDKKVMVDTKRLDETAPMSPGKSELASENKLLSQNSVAASAIQKQGDTTGNLLDNSVESRDFQEKLISVDSYASTEYFPRSEFLYQSCTASSSEYKETSTTLGKVENYHEYMNVPAEIAESSAEISPISHGNVFLKQPGNDSYPGTHNSYSDSSGKKFHVHDVHVVVDQANLSNQEKGTEVDFVSGSTSGILGSSYAPSEASAVKKRSAASASICQISSSSTGEVNRTTSDISSRLPPICPKGKSPVSDFRRNSLSDIDNERLKIGYEVGWLQERLKAVQEGREKLNMSMERQEKENVQLKLLENIANQLKEIRLLSEPRYVARQSSLPPPSSKVISKKRRSRSVSTSQQTSS
ncbi:OLC1v1019208C1 [Oldenlandia corymbosa var. corymbosa]|uniref:OLC1v1019208C1 n=1 Tax=Oldenlandia corymbosa var. corymbosa TaxID=529605 RepID=A0AAV1EDT1_OLDCO|nr:OLC1v1019208C1 [Oldenlandia corymbosa var. corymbosa]